MHSGDREEIAPSPAAPLAFHSASEGASGVGIGGAADCDGVFGETTGKLVDAAGSSFAFEKNIVASETKESEDQRQRKEGPFAVGSSVQQATLRACVHL